MLVEVGRREKGGRIPEHDLTSVEGCRTGLRRVVNEFRWKNAHGKGGKEESGGREPDSWPGLSVVGRSSREGSIRNYDGIPGSIRTQFSSGVTGPEVVLVAQTFHWDICDLRLVPQLMIRERVL